ncbi:MAG: hemerythrin domain-containing protein [Magnetococcales bacterium]|nr:hemerythrin domain-containing protein [Magnetococcales bacterium]
MDPFIQELKDEHQEMLKFLKKLSKLAPQDKNRLSSLNQLRGFVADHLAKEDKQLYPGLIQRAEEDRDLKIILDYYQKHMRKIGDLAQNFLDKHAGEQAGADFKKDLKKLIRFLKGRVLWEEEILFAKFAQ